MNSLLLTAVLAQGGAVATLPLQPDVAPRGAPPNIVLVVADDFGVDLMPSYGEGDDLPCTPVLDDLTASGMLFRNAWASPQCSPARAQLLTGRYGFRTGIGTPGGARLDLSERTVPEMLVGYSSTAVGTWHLGATGANLTHPNDSGFERFAGSRANLDDYLDWTKLVDGQQFSTATYATTDTTDEAIGAILAMPQPFFLHVAFHAPHGPAHAPDPALCPAPCAGGLDCAGVGGGSANWRKTRAMVGAMDTELGRLLDVLDAVDPRAYVFFIGDNGTGNGATRPPFVNGHAKGTLYEGGINVPLVVRGPGIPAGTECAGLVSAVDLFATFAELAGRPSTAEDSVSLVPYFRDPMASLRATVYSESFAPNAQASLPFTNHERAIRDGRFKLIRRTGQQDELFDLAADPWESTDLVPTLTPGSPAALAYQSLTAGLAALGVD
ncbi:MAG: sulfatase-like hydrolase/transferase [Planctomycetota bacterium]